MKGLPWALSWHPAQLSRVAFSSPLALPAVVDDTAASRACSLPAHWASSTLARPYKARETLGVVLDKNETRRADE